MTLITFWNWSIKNDVDSNIYSYLDVNLRWRMKMSNVEEYIDKILNKNSHVILNEAINDIVNICCNTMLENKDINDHAHEWLCFNNLLELIRKRAMEKLEKEDYFK